MTTTWLPRPFRHYTPRHTAQRCATCPAWAESPHASVFRLCASCANARFPGADVDAYARLVSAYGYTR